MHGNVVELTSAEEVQPMLAKEKAANDANDVFAAYWHNGFPVDPVWIARQMGLTVDQSLGLPDVSGMLIAQSETRPVIYVDRGDSEQRRRFTVAHEIGHYYERVSSGNREFAFIDRRGGKYDIHEYYADVFAASLLMPENEVRRQVAVGTSLAKLASYFNVSLSAMRLRLHRLHIRL
jgi:Zn-dependent peptidase ImmA (M78 family)